VTSFQGDGKGPSDRFVADVKQAVGEEMSSQLFRAVRRYKKEGDYESLVTTAVGVLTQQDDNLLLLESKRRQHGALRLTR